MALLFHACTHRIPLTGSRERSTKTLGQRGCAFEPGDCHIYRQTGRHAQLWCISLIIANNASVQSMDQSVRTFLARVFAPCLGFLEGLERQPFALAGQCGSQNVVALCRFGLGAAPRTKSCSSSNYMQESARSSYFSSSQGV